MGKRERFAVFDTIVEQADAVQIILLNGWLKDDHVPCEFQHIHTECSIHVTHVIRWCRPPFRVCASGAESEREVIRDALVGCEGCGRPASVCWRVEPFG